MGRKMSEATGDDDRAPSSPGLLCRRAGELQMGLMVFAELLRQREKKSSISRDSSGHRMGRENNQS